MMTFSSTSSARDSKLNLLWQSRSHLSEDEWSSLYLLVTDFLRRLHFPELASLPESKDDYIQAFFVEKILTREAGNSNTAIHAGYFKVAFKFYLIDELRRQKIRNQVDLNEKDDSNPDESIQLEQLHHIQDKPDEDAFSGVNLERSLAEHGLTIEQIQDSAFEWLKGQELWAQLYLVEHFCPDSQDRPPTLQTLAAKHGIASYHYRARQLGITNKKTDHPSDYADTAIGRWAIGLGIKIIPENMSILLFLFKCLCLATLSLEGDFE
jgi:hypothetical protein